MSMPHHIWVEKPHERALVQVLLLAVRLDRTGKLAPDHSHSMSKLVENLAYEFSGKRSRAIRNIAGLLAEGMSMVDALEQTPRALDPSAVMALRLASETGSVPETLASLVATDSAGEPINTASTQKFSHGVDGKLFQVAIGFAVTWLIVSFLMLFIIPTFEKMFEEFEIALPDSMLLLIDISRYGALLFWMAIFFLVIMLFVERRLKGRSFWNRVTRRSLAEQKAHLLVLFAMVVRQGRPLASGIATLANYHPTPKLRSRLSSASLAITQGTEAWQALYEQEILGRAESIGLAMAERPHGEPGSMAPSEEFAATPAHARQTQAWLLLHLALRRRDQLLQRNGLWLQAMAFVSLIILAVIVMFTAFAVFSSVYKLVSVLS